MGLRLEVGHLIHSNNIRSENKSIVLRKSGSRKDSPSK